MTYVERIEVGGSSSAGPFLGKFEIRPGLFVVSADNAFGKSLASTAVAWCLGLEPMFGLRNDDPVCFPLAVREQLDFPQAKGARVVSSYASVTFRRDDGANLTLRRDIVGNPGEVTIQELDAGKKTPRTSRMLARRKTMADETGGLQNFLFRWFSVPRTKIMGQRGEALEIYLENLAPHFYIDQTEGWSTIQALQVFRYGQQDIAAASVEYLLGADEALRSRLRTQAHASRQSQLKQRAADITTSVLRTFAKQGWPVDWSAHGQLPDIVARWTKTSVTEVARKKFKFDLTNEQARLSKKLDALNARLSKEGLDKQNAASASNASQAVIDLKSRRHALREELRTARTQHHEQQQLIETIEHRIQAARDVVRLKNLGIGRMDEVECPTCHRHLEPASFGLTSQSTAAVETHINALQRDRALVRDNADSVSDQATRLSAEIEGIEEQLRFAERSLTVVNAAAGNVREQLAKIATEIVEVQREMEKNHALAAELDQLQADVEAWVTDAQELVSEESKPGDLKRRIDAFLDSLRALLKALGHAGIDADDSLKIRLDETYTPYLDHRRLRSVGSASDHARLVMAYALALAQASSRVSGHHPGFVIFDEPLQQNPDPKHRDMFRAFLRQLASKPLPYNVLLFTSLEADEVKELLDANVAVTAPTRAHFLELTGAES